MKFANVPNKESSENFSFRLKKSEADALRDYHKYANEVSGVEMTAPEVLAMMVATLIQSDPDYRKWKKTQDKAGKAEKKPSVKATTPMPDETTPPPAKTW